MSFYLGLDASTQSMSCMVIDVDTNEIVYENSINFGSALPQYNSTSGFLHNEDPLIKHADPLMWVESLDLLFSKMKEDNYDLSKIKAISGSGQQHGSVYLGNGYKEAFNFSPEQDLKSQIEPILSRKTAPIWMDSSTTEECNEIAEAIGAERVLSISGSQAIERFTGPQIRKFFKEDTRSYAATERIHLVSSFLASILVGGDAPIDLGDGAGMNLLSLADANWSPELLEATAPDLKDKLLDPVPGGTKIGEVCSYFVSKYGFNSNTEVYAWSGDNPCSLVGLGATAPGTAVISLGTSDTFFGAMSQPKTDPKGYGHVFGNPAGGFMSLICFKNGSLAREAIANKFSFDWDQFSKALSEETSPGNAGDMMLPFFEAEITPRTGECGPQYFGSSSFINGEHAAKQIRAVVEAQAMNMRIHSEWMGDKPTTILMTGGASKNTELLQVFTDVFGATLKRLSTANTAAMGAAFMAAENAGAMSYEELFEKFCKVDPEFIEPNPQSTQIFETLLPQFEKHLEDLLV
ncbi:MAG: carbohydrate kinase [Lentisphaeria bacterium]|nr:carbohydrate kinase [Lentisphaeria bacterium]